MTSCAVPTASYESKRLSQPRVKRTRTAELAERSERKRSSNWPTRSLTVLDHLLHYGRGEMADDKWEVGIGEGRKSGCEECQM